jgi:hypothetical protein
LGDLYGLGKWYPTTGKEDDVEKRLRAAAFFVKMISSKIKRTQRYDLLKDKKYKRIYAEVSDVGCFF